MCLSGITLPALLAHHVELARQLTLGTHILFRVRHPFVYFPVFKIYMRCGLLISSQTVCARQLFDRIVQNHRAADSPVDQLVARFNKVCH